MKWHYSLLICILLTSTTLAQGTPPKPVDHSSPAPITAGIPESAISQTCPALFPPACVHDNGNGFLTGNHNFDQFINFMSNPVFSIDPRAVTELWPIFGSTWTSTIPALPSANIWIPGDVGIYVALSERLSVGVNQGGYMIADFSKGQAGQFLDRFGRLQDRRQFEGQREGWLDLGGFGQYTLIQNPEDQFLVTAGLRWTAPIGSKAIFQGNGPANLAPYLTFGKGFGDIHVLATGGYQFPAGSGNRTANLCYANLHLGRQLFE